MKVEDDLTILVNMYGVNASGEVAPVEPKCQDEPDPKENRVSTILTVWTLDGTFCFDLLPLLVLDRQSPIVAMEGIGRPPVGDRLKG